jgi:signal transduction histidine kinase
MLTHELRNPLAVIELLRGADPSSTATLRKAVRDMADVIDRVDQSERIDGGQLQLESALLDLSAIVEQIARQHTARSRLVVDASSPLPVVSDAALVGRIVENLLDNAAKYSRPGSVIRIMLSDRTEGTAHGCLLRVENEIGTAGPPDPARLFTKYYRAKGAHRQPGSGLGLFLVANWISALGGTITYAQNSQPDGVEQAIFTVWVPK